MDKSTVLRLILEMGAQVDEAALEALANDPVILEQLFRNKGEKLPPVITYDFLKSLSPTIGNQHRKTSVVQLAKVLSDRYEFLRSLLTDRQELVNLISINKIGEKIKQFSVIGIVSEISDTLQLEDPTGKETFSINSESAKNLVEDEVIGVVCERRSGVNGVELVVYPDIPLKKENNKTERPENCFFISDIYMDSQDFNKTYYKNLIGWLEGQKNLNVLVLGGVSTQEEDIKQLLSDIRHPTTVYHAKNHNRTPTTVKIENVEILLSHSPFLGHYMRRWNSSPDTTVVNLLRKRNLDPVLTSESYNNSFLLERIPDIVVMSGVGIPTATNYKGTTIITNGGFNTKPVYWQINLQTRETFKIDFS